VFAHHGSPYHLLEYINHASSTIITSVLITKTLLFSQNSKAIPHDECALFSRLQFQLPTCHVLSASFQKGYHAHAMSFARCGGTKNTSSQHHEDRPCNSSTISKLTHILMMEVGRTRKDMDMWMKSFIYSCHVRPVSFRSTGANLV
jgi:hypothetical protein